MFFPRTILFWPNKTIPFKLLQRRCDIKDIHLSFDLDISNFRNTYSKERVFYFDKKMVFQHSFSPLFPFHINFTMNHFQTFCFTKNISKYLKEEYQFSKSIFKNSMTANAIRAMPRICIENFFIFPDAGKSTIGGQIMYLTGMVDKRTLEKYEREAKEKNRETWYLSWCMDTNLEGKVKLVS